MSISFSIVLKTKCFSSSPKGAPHDWCRRASVNENIWNSKPGQARRSNTVPECVYWLQRVAHLGCRLLASILFITQHGKVVVFICDLWSFEPMSAHLRCTLASSCCWFAWTLWIPGVDSLKLLALIDCTSQSHFPLLPASDSFDMATSAPLLGAEKKGGHSKASIFYGADEYLEDVPYRAQWSFVNLNMFDEAAKLGHSPSSPWIVLGFEKLFVLQSFSARFVHGVCSRDCLYIGTKQTRTFFLRTGTPRPMQYKSL